MPTYPMTARAPRTPRAFRNRARISAILLFLSVGGLGASGALAAVPHGSATVSPQVLKLRWTQLTPTTSPGSRNWAAMAYDAADHYVVLYGGYDPYTAGLYNDTWEFQGGNWTLLHPTLRPSATSGLVLAYDPALKGVLAFGGQSAYGLTYYNETWLFQAGNWTLLSPTKSPPPRSQYAMAFDSASSEMVMFGGYDGGAQYRDDTWTFNGTTWTQVHPKHTPPGREFGSMVYDPVSRLTLLIGGQNTTFTGTVGSLALGGTWAFSGGQWKALRHLSSTPLTEFEYLTNLRNGTPVLFGGQSPHIGAQSNTTYEFFAGAWHHVRTPHATPSPRNNGGFAYDGHDGYVVLFGGKDVSGGYDGDTWKLR